MAKAVEYLAKLEPKRTYVVSLQTQVFARADAKKYKELIQKNADWLLKEMIETGGKLEGWSYPGNQIADNSNTHFAVMGLHAAAQAGAKIDAKVWDRLREFYTRTQSKPTPTTGAWSYHNVGRGIGDDSASFTMTVAGVCGLLIAGMGLDQSEQQLDPATGVAANCGVYAENDAVARGMNWVGARFTIERGGKSIFYNVYGIERLPKLEPNQSFLLVCNHRSFFDLYVVIGELVRRGLPQRIVFPVRANFFYTNPLGLFVNGVMSFFAMYPPIFREPKKAALNIASLDELTWLLRRGGVFAGLHPEGTRKKDDDPYTLLPAQRGVGRVIRDAGVPVIPVFINGLLNDLPEQIKSNFTRTGRKIVVVFGEPIDFGELMQAPSTPKVHQAIADRALEFVAALGREEQAHRAALESESAGVPLMSP